MVNTFLRKNQALLKKKFRFNIDIYNKHNQAFVILELEKLNDEFEEFKQENNIKNVNEQGVLMIFLKQWGLDCLTLELILFNKLFYKKILNKIKKPNSKFKNITSTIKKY